MLFELFMHGTENFKGLAVYDTWPEKQCYPVISISLYGFEDPDTFEADLCRSLIDALEYAKLPALKERALGVTDIDAFFSKVGFALSSYDTVWLIDVCVTRIPAFSPGKISMISAWIRTLLI